MKVLIGCESSGIIRDAFLARGHEAMSCDLVQTERPGPHYQGDVRDVLDYPWDLAIMHPPCTNTSTSGARWFPEKRMDGRQQSGVAFFLGLWRRLEHVPRLAFEHPVSVISTLWRKPDQIIQPWQFWHLDEHGKGEVKATCLWTRGSAPAGPHDARGARPLPGVLDDGAERHTGGRPQQNLPRDRGCTCRAVRRPAGGGRMKSGALGSLKFQKGQNDGMDQRG